MARRSNGEGSITQRKDGRWQASLQLDGKRHVVYGRTRAEARARLGELQTQAGAAGRLPDPGARTVNALLDAWLEAGATHWKPKTTTTYTELMTRHVRPALGDVRLARLRPERVQAILTTLLKQGKRRTAQQVHTYLHGAFSLAVRWGWLAQSPLDRVDKPACKAARRQIWTADQVRHFLAATEWLRWQSLWTLAVLSGARIGELLALRWEHIDWAAGVMRIEQTLTEIHGSVIFSDPKTEAGRRVVALPAAGMAALRREKAQQAERRLRAGGSWHDCGLVFSTETGEPIRRRTPYQALRKAAHRLGLPVLTMHDLRHLSASLALDAGVPVAVVSRRLGHAKASTTLGVYAHAMRPDALAADALGKALSG